MPPVAWTLFAALCLGQAPVDNLDFRHGNLDGWEGDGFYLTCGNPRGPGLDFGVCSSDAGCKDRKGKIRRTFTVPSTAGTISFRAFAGLGRGCEPDHRLDVVLLDEKKAPIPKRLRTAHGWQSISGLLPRWQGKPRTYGWDVSGHRGKTLTLIIRDQDDRPGCYVYTTGFRVESAPQFQGNDFAHFMLHLQEKHKLEPMARYDSKRFTAISNANEKFTKMRLHHCEKFYDLFLAHFRGLGFEATAPSQRLMLAVFDGPEGFDAYFGRKVSTAAAGIYHTASNRLVIYDLKESQGLLAWQEKSAKLAEMITDKHQRDLYLATAERRARDMSRDANLATTVHEVAHQMSFNCGMLSRDSDVPAWLAEGLATYCEATDQGDWQFIGAPNPSRVIDLKLVVDRNWQFIPLAKLIDNDQWVHSPHVLLGYAQAWALFRMVITERPEQLKAYLAAIRQRRGPDQRLNDFRQAFGVDLGPLEQRYHEYMREMVAKHAPLPGR